MPRDPAALGRLPAAERRLLTTWDGGTTWYANGAGQNY